MDRTLWPQQKIKAASGSGSAVATFTAADFPDGTRNVYLAWASMTNASTDVTSCKVAQGATTFCVFAHDYEFGVERWEPPIMVDIEAGDLTVTATGTGNLTLQACCVVL